MRTLPPVLGLTVALSALFGGMGAALPFLPRWLEEERGLDGVEIGAVLSAAALLRLIVGPMVGTWADGLADRRSAARLLATGAALTWLAFFTASGFVPLLLLGFLAHSLLQATVPLVEGATLRASATGPLSFGVARGIGSAAFVAGNLAGGQISDRFGVGALPVWVVGAYALAAGVAWWLLAPDPSPVAGVGLRERLSTFRALLGRRSFVAVLVAAGLAQAGHAFFYGFSALVWAGQGLGADTIGALWALGVVVEIGFLWTLPAFERRLSPEALLVAGAAGGVARWMVLGLEPPLAVLWPAQALHALSFAAVHVGALRIVQRESPPAVIGASQTLYAAVTGGTLTGLATLASGGMYEAWGARGYWPMAGLAAAALILLARRR
jgi:PPP family 3-phenylpropionic acid transporter